MNNDDLNLEAAKIAGVDARMSGVYVVRPLGQWATTIWEPTDKMDDAMKVVEAMRAKGYGVTIHDNIFMAGLPWVVKVATSAKSGEAVDPSLPRAITLACVKAKEGE